MTVDVPRVEAALRAFASRHRVHFEGFGTRRSQLLELSALMLAINHYALKGYTVGAENADGGVFRVKRSANGLPWRFSWFRAERNGAAFEVHANLEVESSYRKDHGIYVVDVAVVEAGSVPRAKPAHVPNTSVITILEAKALVVYPMLLAQFIGIVHEIKREFLRTTPPPRIMAEGHFYPCLAALGHLQGRSVPILAAYERRGFWVQVVHSFDLVVSGRGLAYAGDSALRP